MKVLSKTKLAGTRLGDRIRIARHAASLSQAGLAERLGLTPGAVAQWESPHGTTPGIDRLEAIATVTGTAFDWLATGRGEARRRKNSNEPAPAVTLEAFAQNISEEILLDRFRRLPPPAQNLLNSFLEAITPQHR